MKPPTAREKQVCELACLDLTDKQIASELGVTVHAIDQAWRRLKTKTGTHSRAATCWIALTTGLRVSVSSQSEETTSYSTRK